VSDSAFWAPLFRLTQTTPSHQQRTSEFADKDYVRLRGTVKHLVSVRLGLL